MGAKKSWVKESGEVVEEEKGKEGMKIFAGFSPPNASTIARQP